MKFLRVFVVFICIIQSFSLLGQDSLIRVSHLPLKNMYQIDDNLYRSEQPEKSDFSILEAFGIKEIMNLRFYHSDKDELPQHTNLVLHRVKMNAHHIEDEDVIAALKIIKNRKGALLFHCKHGSDRTGLICAMYRIVFQHWSKEKAIEELKDERLGYHKIFFNIVNYIESVNVEQIKAALD